MSLKTPRSPSAPWLWIAVLAVASVALNFKLSCATPFAALAALAAPNLKRADGLALVALAWAANQAVGYLFLGYPHEADSYAWGLAIGVAALAAFLAADAIAARLSHPGRPLMMAATLVASFAVYEAALYAASAVLPSTDAAFSWTVIGQIGLVNALVFPGLLLAHKAAVLMGFAPVLPAASSSR